MKRFLTRYHPRYLRSLVYMLQASEYHIGEYLAWVGRVQDFRAVEKRKTVRWTPKASVLYICAWVIVALWLYVEYRAKRAVDAGNDVPLVVGLGLLVLVPLLMPVLILIPLLILKLIQSPIERAMIASARIRLKKHPGFKIAIAGSYGKTSMREILKTVLSAGKKVAAPGGSENTPIAIARFVNRLRGDEEVLIFELGEYYPGDIKLLSEMVQPDLGIITGVNEAHLEKFGTVERAADTVFELADFLRGKPLYVNAENQIAKNKIEKGPIFFSRDGVFPQAGGWSVAVPETSLDGTSFILGHTKPGAERITIQSKLLGLHQIGPLAAAAHIGKRLGLIDLEIEAGAAKTKAFAHRLERKDDPSGVITLDDSYNGNPDGVKAVIEFLASIEGHRRWYVTPGLVEMGDRTEAVHREIGRQLAGAGVEKVVLIKNSVTPWIEQGLAASGFKGEVVWFDDALTCYNSIPHVTVSGDVVVLQNDWPDQYS
jgi:UDP-N-acetylmuramoyl-tripeptide--D-alanyl-D-alanine ligase